VLNRVLDAGFNLGEWLLNPLAGESVPSCFSALAKEFVAQPLHDRHERFAFLLGADTRSRSIDEQAELAPGDSNRHTGRSGSADQPPAALNKVALTLPGHPGKLNHEDPRPYLVY
jgi:hypothetical protein